MEIWLKNGMCPFHGFYDFDQQIRHFFTNSQKFEISCFLSLFPKYLSQQDWQHLILKLLTRNFGLTKNNMALGLRVLGLEDKVSMHVFFTQNLCIYTVLVFWALKKSCFCFSLLIFLQKEQKIEENQLTELGGHYLVVTL